MAGPVPLIPDAPDIVYHLPRGLYHSGTWQTEVQLRELTGADEETLAKAKDPVAFFSLVIALAVTRIGEVDLAEHNVNEKRSMLSELLIGEREQLYLQAAAVSFGNSKEMQFTCTNCEADQQMTILLDTDFPPREVEDIDKTSFVYTTSRGAELEYRPALGSDQDEVLSRKGITLAEQNSILLSRCILRANGQMLVNPLTFVRGLAMRDRQQMMALLVQRQPSISLDLRTICSTCGSEQTIQLGWGDIFRSQ